MRKPVRVAVLILLAAAALIWMAGAAIYRALNVKALFTRRQMEAE